MSLATDIFDAVSGRTPAEDVAEPIKHLAYLTLSALLFKKHRGEAPDYESALHEAVDDLLDLGVTAESLSTIQMSLVEAIRAYPRESRARLEAWCLELTGEATPLGSLRAAPGATELAQEECN